MLVRARLTAPSRSVLRSLSLNSLNARRAAFKSVVAASAKRAGLPASTIAIASPSRAEASSSRAARMARSNRTLPSAALARMLCESSTTKANATDAPALRPKDKREHCTKGVAPMTAKQAIFERGSLTSDRTSRRHQRSRRKIPLLRPSPPQQMRGYRDCDEKSNAERRSNEEAHNTPPTESRI